MSDYLCRYVFEYVSIFVLKIGLTEKLTLFFKTLHISTLSSSCDGYLFCVTVGTLELLRVIYFHEIHETFQSGTYVTKPELSLFLIFFYLLNLHVGSVLLFLLIL